MHLVLVDERHAGRLPKLDDVRDAVRRDWENTLPKAMIDQFYRTLPKKHEIIVGRPKAGAQEGAPYGSVDNGSPR